MEEYLSTDIYVSKRNNSLINGKMIGRVLGVLLFIEAGMFVLCSGISVVYGESNYKYFLYTAGINLLSGALLMFYGRGAENRLSRRDGYCIVTLSWVFFTLFGMLPFYLSGSIDSLTNAFFETMSGFTTTGATILDDIAFAWYAFLAQPDTMDWRAGDCFFHNCRIARFHQWGSTAFFRRVYGSNPRPYPS